jgi:hypothetical protein
MRVLFDQGTPAPLRRSLVQNGALIAAAEDSGFDVLLTTDKNLRYQQNMAGRKLAILVLSTTSWPRIRAGSVKVQAALDAASPGSYVEIAID